MYVVMFALILAAHKCSTLLSESILLCTETNIVFHSPLLNERASIAAKYILPEVVWNCLASSFLGVNKAFRVFLYALHSQSVLMYHLVTMSYNAVLILLESVSFLFDNNTFWVLCGVRVVNFLGHLYACKAIVWLYKGIACGEGFCNGSVFQI